MKKEMNPSYEIDELYNEAMRLKSRKLYESAAVILDKAIAGAANIQDLGLSAQLLDARGCVAFCAGDYQTAREKLISALGKLEVMFSPVHGSVAPVLDHLCRLNIAENKFAAAKPLAERSLSIKERCYHPAHSEVFEAMRMCAIIDEELGDYERAENLLVKGITLLKPMTIGIYEEFLVSLANVYRSQKMNEKAEALYKQALDLFEKRSGRTLRAAHAFNEYAKFLEMEGRASDASQMRGRAAIMEQNIQTIEEDESLPSTEAYQRISYPMNTFQ
jgi:tetratricopeptide (TPR) repeat protein